ncbi:MAG: DUF2130 domain-containing protein [Verrucomicrobia bacterium]|nr:DUF2130 domain-containing protein [Verrucomicrobiota bacterium]
MLADEDPIRLSLEQEVVCPHDNLHRFVLRAGLAESTIQQLQRTWAQEQARELDRLRAEIGREYSNREKALEQQLQQLTAEIAGWRSREATLLAERAKFEKEKAEQAVNLAKQLEAERETISQTVRAEELQRAKVREQILKDQMDGQNQLIQEIQTQLALKNSAEIALKRAIEDLKLSHQEALQKVALEARQAAAAEAVQKAEQLATQKFRLELDTLRLKQRELEKQRDDARQVAENLRRKMEQGSQQTQGEVLELILERELASRFGTDRIEPISKGVFGADVVQHVLSGDGRACGSITWETKNTQNWNPKWLEKLRADMIANKSEFGILVSTVLPDGVDHFGVIDGLWVCDLKVWPILATTLRQQLIALTFARLSSEGRDRKMEILYRYLTGPEFRERVNAVLRTFVGMKEQLEREKRALIKQWSAREKQIETVIDGMSGMYGDLQGIIGSASLPEIASLRLDEPDEGPKLL